MPAVSTRSSLRHARWLLLSMLCGLPVLGSTQPATVSGYVTDQAARTPLAGANVFLSGTTRGSATDDQGFFQIADVPPGRYELVASMLGYETRSHPLDLSGSRPGPIQLALAPDTLVLDDVVVIAERPREWHRNLRQFRELFFGFTAHADACELINPEVLSFTYEKRTRNLTATAEAPLIVENHALGYRIAFYVDHFEGRAEALDWGGATFFTELEPDQPDDLEDWQQNRRSAYEGSTRHFLAALVNQSVRQEGFQLHAVDAPGTPGRGPSDDALTARLLAPGDLPHERELQYGGVLHIVYLRERDRGLYGFESHRHQNSWLHLPTGRLTIDTMGVPTGPVNHLNRFGYWARERVADLLPRDYQLGNRPQGG